MTSRSGRVSSRDSESPLSDGAAGRAGEEMPGRKRVEVMDLISFDASLGSIAICDDRTISHHHLPPPKRFI